MQFFKIYEKATYEKKSNIKENFIHIIRGLDTEDTELTEFMLIVFGFPGATTMHNWNVIEERGPDANKKIREFRGSLDKVSTHEIVRDAEYHKLASVYDVALERVRYKAKVRLTPFYVEICKNNKSVYSTQVGNVMTKTDANTYMECMFLTNVAGDVSLGDRSKLFRSVESYGDRERGSSYHDFERVFAKPTHLTEAQLAVAMRRVLRGETPDVRDLHFIPNLVGAWFVAEAVRNPLSLMSGLILLDMIESGVQLQDGNGNNWYSWRNSLIHPLKSSAIEKEARDLYGSKIKNIDLFGGAPPMAHGGSVAGALEELEVNTKLTPVRQKEASLILHWLYTHLAAKGVPCRLVNVSEERLQHANANFEELSEGVHDSPRLQQLNKKIEKLQTTIRVKRSKDADANIAKEEAEIEKSSLEHDVLIAKQKVQREIITPELKARLSTLDNLFNSERVAVVSEPPALEEVLPHLVLIVNEQLLKSLVQVVSMDHLVVVSEEKQKLARGLIRAKAIRDAVKKECVKRGRVDPVITKLKHVQTISDGNCAFNAVALGLLFHKHNENDLFTSNEEFRKVFAEVFQIDTTTFSQEAFSLLVEALISPNINLSNPLIKKIIQKLENVGEVIDGGERNQLVQRMNLLRNAVIQGAAYEKGNIKPQYHDVAIRCLAERGELLQIVMPMALRRYCINNKGTNVTFTHLADGNILTEPLNTPNAFGAYVGSYELNFLANRFGLRVNEKHGEFGGWANYGTSDNEINVFCMTPGAVDCHYELLLSGGEALLDNRLVMDQEVAHFTAFVASNLQQAFLSKSGLGLYPEH